MVSPDRFGTFGVAIAMSACVACGGVFCFDPDQVPSVFCKLGTGRGTGLTLVTSDTGGPDYTREPICPDCATRINPERARLGLELIPEHDTAEALIQSIGKDGP